MNPLATPAPAQTRLGSSLAKLRALWTDDASHQPLLTGIRGCAAVWVYLFHLWFQSGKPAFHLVIGSVTFDLTPPVSIGFAGITLFFVLSGFLLALPFAQWQAGQRERPPLKRYLLRRILRVFPAYYAQLAILLLVAAATGGWTSLPDLGAFLRHLIMLFLPPPWGASPLNGVWWTLPIEFSFYLLLPLLAFLLRPGRWWWLLLGSLAAMWLWRHAVIIRLAEAPVPLRVISSYQLAGSFDMFGLGMLGAVIHVNRSRLPAWLSRALRRDGTLLLGLAILLVAAYWLAADRQHYWADYPIFYLWTPLVSFGTLLLILSGTSGNPLPRRLFGNPAVVYLGIISYSLYLWHLSIIDWLIALPALNPLIGRSFLGLLAVSLPIVLLVSTLSYWWVERPCMRLRRK